MQEWKPQGVEFSKPQRFEPIEERRCRSEVPLISSPGLPNQRWLSTQGEKDLTDVSQSARQRSGKFPSDTFLYVVVTLTACVVVMAFHLPDRWLAAVFCTVVPFLGTITYFRSRWSSTRFWSIVRVAFLLHVLAIFLIFGVLLRRRDDVGLGICLPAALLEGLLLVGAVRQWGSPRPLSVRPTERA